MGKGVRTYERRTLMYRLGGPRLPDASLTDYMGVRPRSSPCGYPLRAATWSASSFSRAARFATYTGLAEALNESGIETPQGRRWHPMG
jgi:hypothetical protein